MPHQSTPTLVGFWLCFGCALVPTGMAWGQQPTLNPLSDLSQKADRHFQQSVLPVLESKCFSCHGNDPKKVRGNLDVRSRAGLLKGGQSGKPAVVPGQPDNSLLFLAIQRTDPDRAMPPKENDKLNADQGEAIKLWIKDGARWPSTTTPENHPDGIIIATSGGRTEEWTHRKYKPEDIWAYRPASQITVPSSDRSTSFDRNAIDAFLLQKLHLKGIQHPSAEADKRTLLRRLAMDLTGLPPRSSESDDFLNDHSPAAFEKLVDRLLASPHYGEQQTRHWLDVVRYADTAGFSNDFERPNAWRYRDYVVRSFNNDKPFDRFIVEQLAGDEKDADDPEMLIAVGFLRMGPWEHTGMSVARVTRQQFLDDITHSVGVTFLGQGLRCASCHDHKFDPIPTRDYYRIQAAFAPVQFAERDDPFLACENTSGFTESRARVQAQLKQSQAEVDRLRKKSDDAIAAFLKDKGLTKLTDLPEADRPKKDRHGLTNLELSLIRIHQKRIQTFERELLRFQPNAFSIYNGPPNNYFSPKALNPMPGQRNGIVQAVHVLGGGSLESPAEEVAPGTLSAVSRPKGEVPATMEDRRLALAQWIANPANPLTARVIVNRVWQQHFGKGLVATPNNFGKMGQRPTHPELLDWLAAWFVENGWSIKKLHRLIVTSAAYRQSSEHPEMKKLQEIDPGNQLVAYFPTRRLAAEEIRDAMLAITGELNLTAGGPGVFPEINWEVALQPRHVMGSVAPAYQPSPLPHQRNRRTLYAFRQRTLVDPIQEVFNRPGSETSCERRDETTVTPQSFALFNSEFSHDRALALAAALTKRSTKVDDRIREAFRLCYHREPNGEEQVLCREHVAKMTAHHRDHPPTPTELPLRVKRKMVEEMTGEEYEWDEELDGMKGYQRDLKPWQVGPETRAMADLCLVLFNSNEFLYVR